MDVYIYIQGLIDLIRCIAKEASAFPDLYRIAFPPTAFEFCGLGGIYLLSQDVYPKGYMLLECPKNIYGSL